MKRLISLMQRYREIISYLFWGGMTTLVSWGSYALFALLLQALPATVVTAIANVLSWICAVVFAFVTNKLWVFNSKSWAVRVWVRELGTFISARLITGVLEIAGVPFLVSIGLDQKVLGVEGMAAKMLVSIAVIILNYLFSKLFIFKKKENEE